MVCVCEREYTYFCVGVTLCIYIYMMMFFILLEAQEKDGHTTTVPTLMIMTH